MPDPAEYELIAALVLIRRRAGYSRATIAHRMRIPTHRLRALEQLQADPRLSTLRRYALALGARVEHEVIDPDGPASLLP